ncbi:MAG: GGDEF domain-containing protein [Gammaproteobacteria bacterium]|nr:GGDEF domain-containing protein [Gammaproteobacteria bacterium]
MVLLKVKDEELSQSVARITISSSFFIYIIILNYNMLLGIQILAYILPTAGTIILSLLHYLWVKRQPGIFFYRRIFTIILDLGMTTYFMILNSQYTGFFYPLYMWIIVGNGIRFGTQYLFIAMTIGFVGFSTVLYSSSFWVGDNRFLGFGLLASIIILPSFYYLIIRRLHNANTLLENEVKASQYLASYDSLTKIPNRNAFTNKLEHYYECLTPIGLAFIDLDGFKTINDNYGHAVGDSVLVEVGKRLEVICKKKSYYARLGGDEFTIISTQGKNHIIILAEQLVDILNQPYMQGQSSTISASIGIVLSNFENENTTDLLRRADKAMYNAKSAGKNRYFFSENNPVLYTDTLEN